MQENEFEKRQLLRLEFESVEREIETHKRSLLRLERQRKKLKIKLLKSFLATFVCFCLCRYFIDSNFIYAMTFGVMFLYFLLIRFPYFLLSYLADSGVPGIRKIFFKNYEYCYAKDKEKNIIELAELEARRDKIEEESGYWLDK